MQRAGDHVVGDEATRRHLRGVRRFYMSFPVEEFVEAVRQQPFLFDRDELEFKNVAKKEAMWEAIGQQFGISGRQALNKWRNLRDKYFKVRKQELLERHTRTPRFRKPVKTWAFYQIMRQILDRKHHAPASASQGTEGTEGTARSNESAMAELGIDPSWVAANGVEVYDPELASVNLETTVRLENEPMVTIKQELPDEMEPTVSEQVSMVSVNEEEPAVDSEHEDEATLASLERSITWARALFHKRRKEFKNAVESLDHERLVISPSTPAEPSCPEICLVSESVPSGGVQAQTSTPLQQQQRASVSGITEPVPSHSPAVTTSPTLCTEPPAVEDGLEHFGLFVAQRLRMVDSVIQARLMSAILNLLVNTPKAT